LLETHPLDSRDLDRVNWIASIPFFLMHIACLLAFWVGVSWTAVITALILYYVRMFGITGGYHRYFAHASFKTSRAFQFILAWIGCSSMQKGPLWWASLHRHHHAHSDDEHDIHSPLQRGFWWSHVGWIICNRYNDTMWNLIHSFRRYPELLWLNKYHVVPGLTLGVAVFFFGWLLEVVAPSLGTNRYQMLIWGWLISTVLLYHGTFTINSLAHVFGSRRFPTKDGSRNNFWLALITMGEGWHNNHHYLPSSARMGFRWYEIDFSLYVLTVLSWLGIVWDLKKPPRHLLEPAAEPLAKAS
jgi:stearoyl-CoA desaturase (delta-9 desaturase)